MHVIVTHNQFSVASDYFNSGGGGGGTWICVTSVQAIFFWFSGVFVSLSSQINLKAHYIVFVSSKYLCLFRQFIIGKGKLNDKTHNTRTHFGTSHHPQNSIKLPNYCNKIRQFSLTVRRPTNKKSFFSRFFFFKLPILEYLLMLTFQFWTIKLYKGIYSLLIST